MASTVALNHHKPSAMESYDTKLITAALMWADMRKLARLVCSGKSYAEIRQLVKEVNILQRKRTKTALNIFWYLSQRISGAPEHLLLLIADGDSVVSRQASLLASLQTSRFLREFLGNVVCERLESFNPELPSLFWEDFWSSCLANDPALQGIRPKTVSELRQTLLKFLVEIEVLESYKSRSLKAVRFHPHVLMALKSSELSWLKPYVRSFAR